MSTQRRKTGLSEIQLQIMSVIWRRREATVADVWKELSAGRKTARNTVLTHMTRLENRGYLQHRAVGNKFYFSSVKRRAATLRQLVSTIVDAAFGGSASALVKTLLAGKGVGRDEAERIREMIDEATKEKQG